MNISKFTSKLALASLIFSVVQGPVLAMDKGTEEVVNAVAQEATKPTEVVVEGVVAAVVQEAPISEVVETAKEAGETAKAALNNETVKQETKKIVDKFLELKAVQATGSFVYHGVNGVVDGFVDGTTKLVCKMTPESTLGKIGVASAVFIVTGTVVTVTYYFKDKTYVKATLGALKSVVTSPKALAACGLVALCGGYTYETGDWKTPAYVLGTVTALWGLKKLANFGWSKFRGNAVVPAYYQELLTILTEAKEAKAIPSGAGEKLKAIFANKTRDSFLAGLEKEKNEFFANIQSYKKAKRGQGELKRQAEQKFNEIYVSLKTKLQAKIS